MGKLMRQPISRHSAGTRRALGRHSAGTQEVRRSTQEVRQGTREVRQGTREVRQGTREVRHLLAPACALACAVQSHARLKPKVMVHVDKNPVGRRRRGERTRVVLSTCMQERTVRRAAQIVEAHHERHRRRRRRRTWRRPPPSPRCVHRLLERPQWTSMQRQCGRRARRRRSSRPLDGCERTCGEGRGRRVEQVHAGARPLDGCERTCGEGRGRRGEQVHAGALPLDGCGRRGERTRREAEAPPVGKRSAVVSMRRRGSAVVSMRRSRRCMPSQVLGEAGEKLR